MDGIATLGVSAPTLRPGPWSPELPVPELGAGMLRLRAHLAGVPEPPALLVLDEPAEGTPQVQAGRLADASWRLRARAAGATARSPAGFAGLLADLPGQSLRLWQETGGGSPAGVGRWREQMGALQARLDALAELDPQATPQDLRERLAELRATADRRLQLQERAWTRRETNQRLLSNGELPLVRDLVLLRAVPAPWRCVDLTRLNDLRRYSGQHAMAEIARDLELAHWLGLLTIEPIWATGHAGGISPAGMWLALRSELAPRGAHRNPLPWIVGEQLGQAVRALLPSGAWAGKRPEGDAVTIVHLGGGRFTVNGEPADPDEAEVELLLANESVCWLGGACAGMPAECMRELGWQHFQINRDVAVALRADARALERDGSWTNPEGSVISFRPADPKAQRLDPEFAIDGAPVDPFHAQVMFLLAHRGVSDLPNAHTVLPLPLRGPTGRFRWRSAGALTRETALAILAAVPQLDAQGECTVRGSTLTYDETGFAVNGTYGLPVEQRWVAWLIDRHRTSAGKAAGPVIPAQAARKEFKMLEARAPDGRMCRINHRQHALLRALDGTPGWHTLAELDALYERGGGPDRLCHRDVPELVDDGLLAELGPFLLRRYAVPSTPPPAYAGQAVSLRARKLIDVLERSGRSMKVQACRAALGSCTSSTRRSILELEAKGLVEIVKHRSWLEIRLRAES